MKNEKYNKHPAKKIFCPITYACIDSSGRVVRERMGVGIGINQKSIIIEANSVIASQNILLSYVDLSQKLIEIKGNLDSCTKVENGKYRAEISFTSPQVENNVFIKKIVLTHRIMD